MNQYNMPYSRPQRYAIVAQERRADGELENAGIYYTAAAHGWFMHFLRLPEDIPDQYSIPAYSFKHLGRGVQDMLAAGLCFRLANSLYQCQNHCKQGLLVAEELIERDEVFRESDKKPRVGLLHEMIGDLRLFGELGEHDEAYAAAEEQYEGVKSQRNWQSEPEFDSLMRLLVELAKSTDYELDKRTEERILHKSLLDRIKYKRKHYPSIIEGVLADGMWESDTL